MREKQMRTVRCFNCDKPMEVDIAEMTIPGVGRVVDFPELDILKHLIVICSHCAEHSQIKTAQKLEARAKADFEKIIDQQAMEAAKAIVEAIKAEEEQFKSTNIPKQTSEYDKFSKGGNN